MLELRPRVLSFIVVAALGCTGPTGDDSTELVEGAITAGNTYYLKLPKMVGDTGNCVDVYGLSTADKATIDEWDCNGSAAQKFVAVGVGNGYYQLKNTNSGKCLNVYSGALDAVHTSTGNQDGSLIQQYTCTGYDNNYWKPVAYNGYIQFVSKLNTGDGLNRCIDIRGGDTFTANGSVVELWKCGAAGTTKGNQTINPVTVTSTPSPTGAGGSGGTGGTSGSGGSGGTGGDTVINGIHHPGMVSSEAELLRIRTIVNAAISHPMKDGWNKLRSTRFAQLDYTPTPYAVVHVVGSGGNAEEAALRNDAAAAYAHALQWAVLEDPRYATKAIEIMRAWSAVLTDVVPATTSDPQVQDELEVAWYAPIWLNAAELIRYHKNGAAGWSAADRTAFDKMVAIFKTKADAWEGSKSCCPNQGVSVAFHRLSLGVYTSNKAYVDAAVTFFRDTMLTRAISATGEIIEINRTAGGDCAHATFNVEGIFDIAETAWHQGIDLYANALMPKGLEYMAQLDTTGAQTTSEGFVTCTTKPSSIEIAYNHYTNRVGTPSLPHTAALLTKIRPTDQGTGKFIPWDTLTHADLDK